MVAVDAKVVTDQEFAQIVGDTKRAVLGAIRAHLRPDLSHAVDDVAQEAYVRMYRFLKKNGSLRGDRLDSWAYTVTRNECLRMNGKPHSRRVTTAPEDFEVADHRAEEEQARMETELALNEQIDQVAEPYRTTLKLLAEGLSTSDIAERLGIPGGTAKSRVSRGRNLLREILKSEREEQTV